MLCVIAKLDSDSIEKLRALQNKANDFNVFPADLYGHITIAAYIGDDELAFIKECKKMIKGIGPFIVRYDKLEVLSETEIIVASLQKNGALLYLHDNIEAQYGEFLNQWTVTEKWYPHTTLLSNSKSELTKICKAMQESFFSFQAVVNSIEFSRVTEAGYEIVDRITLE